MKRNGRIILSIIWILLGMTLFVLGLMEFIDEFWASMGSALMTVGFLQMIKFYRLSRNETYREKMEIEMTDERNHFIRNKAWAWTGYLFVLIVSVSVIVFRLFGQEVLSTAAGYAVCLMLILYYISYFVLRKKY